MFIENKVIKEIFEQICLFDHYTILWALDMAEALGKDPVTGEESGLSCEEKISRINEIISSEYAKKSHEVKAGVAINKIRTIIESLIKSEGGDPYNWEPEEDPWPGRFYFRQMNDYCKIAEDQVLTEDAKSIITMLSLTFCIEDRREPSQEQLAVWLNKSVAQVQHGLEELRANGWIKVSSEGKELLRFWPDDYPRNRNRIGHSELDIQSADLESGRE
ncbi:MAG: hypothetical protein HQK60_00925 [Deltaproteobacteria bacterium]|nr:hypothetical protein [Deltaproteobacteria bacterium]